MTANYILRRHLPRASFKLAADLLTTTPERCFSCFSHVCTTGKLPTVPAFLFTSIFFFITPPRVPGWSQLCLNHLTKTHTHSVPLFFKVDMPAICTAWLPIQFYLLPLVCSVLGEILRTCDGLHKRRALLNRLCAQTLSPTHPPSFPSCVFVSTCLNCSILCSFSFFDNVCALAMCVGLSHLLIV